MAAQPPPGPGGPPTSIDLQNQLRAARTQLQAVTAERDALQGQAGALRGERDSLQKQNEQLQAELAQLKAQPAPATPPAGIGKPIAAVDLASRFATVVEKLAAAKPAEGSDVVAALTSLEVEARGLLHVPEGQSEIQFSTIEGGDVKPESISTVKMTFRPIPKQPSPQGP